MGSEGWESTTIGALLARDGGSVKTGPFGTVLKSAEYSTDGVPLISVGEVGYGSLEVRPSTPRAPKEVVERLPEYVLKAGDIVFGRKGAIDRSAHVRPDQAGWFLGSDGIRLRVPPTCDSRFVAYHLQSPSTRSWLIQHATGSTMPSLNQNTIERIPIALPSINEQRRIAGILGALDDKIELNHRMSQTLESMASALFKSWFIDFDPVRAKVEGRDPDLPGPLAGLFPDSFEDSELGEIPAGWKVEPLGVLGQIAIGGVWGEEVAFSGAVSAVCLRGVDLEHLRLEGSAKAPRRWFKPSSLGSRNMDDRDVLVAGSGAGPTGRPLWMSPALAKSLGPSTYSNFCKRIRCNSPAAAIYLDACLQGMRESGEVWEYVNGTSIPNLDATSLLANKLVVVPSQPILERHGSFVGAIWDAKYGRRDTSLATLRDDLLARLLGSGGPGCFSKDSATAQLGRSA